MANATKKASKRADKWNANRPKNGSRQKCKMGYRVVVYCSEDNKMVTVGESQRAAVCPAGHRIEIRNGIRK